VVDVVDVVDETDVLDEADGSVAGPEVTSEEPVAVAEEGEVSEEGAVSEVGTVEVGSLLEQLLFRSKDTNKDENANTEMNPEASGLARPRLSAKSTVPTDSSAESAAKYTPAPKQVRRLRATSVCAPAEQTRGDV